MDKFECFIERLRKHPKLLDNFESLMNIVENRYGDMELADHVEECVIENTQRLGHDVIENWANNQSIKKCEQFSISKKGRKDTKKK